MSNNFELNAEIRQDLGKGASRRLRREKKIPAVIYGGGQDAVSLVINHDKVFHSLEREAFYTSILDITIDGKSEKAVLKDVQRHPYKPLIRHIDLLRINKNETLRMNVPLHFLSEDVAAGVKAGGAISHLQTDVEVVCLPAALPEYIELDVANLEMGSTLHLSDLVLPEGVQLVELLHGDGHDQPIISIHQPRGLSVDEETVEAAPAAEEGAAPEGEG